MVEVTRVSIQRVIVNSVDLSGTCAKVFAELQSAECVVDQYYWCLTVVVLVYNCVC